MEKEIKNKIAVVTGGSRGIGSAISEELLKHGAKKVIIIDIEEEQGIDTTNTLNSKFGNGAAVFMKGDVTNEDDLNKMYDEIVEKYQNVDILVNNAGIVDETSIRRTINVNTIATVEWTMKFIENMRKDKGGKGGTVLNIASIFGYTVDPALPFYKTSKYAIMGFTKTLGHFQIYEVTGVRVIALCPGVTNTGLGEEQKFNTLDFMDTILDTFVCSLPTQEKEDVARAAMQVIKNAESGSAWNIINAQAIQEVA